MVDISINQGHRSLILDRISIITYLGSLSRIHYLLSLSQLFFKSLIMIIFFSNFLLSSNYNIKLYQVTEINKKQNSRRTRERRNHPVEPHLHLIKVNYFTFNDQKVILSFAFDTYSWIDRRVYRRILHIKRFRIGKVT